MFEHKRISYFRFPFNDMGQDNLQYLEQHHYKIAPYTIESSNLAFNDIYEYSLSANDTAKAIVVAEECLDKHWRTLFILKR